MKIGDLVRHRPRSDYQLHTPPSRCSAEWDAWNDIGIVLEITDWHTVAGLAAEANEGIVFLNQDGDICTTWQGDLILVRSG